MSDETTALATMENTRALTVERERWKIDLARAKTLIQSGLLPDTIKTPQQALAIMWFGRELGLAPWAAFNSIYVVKGRPSMSSNVMVALVRKSTLGKFESEEGEGWCKATGTRTDNGDTYTAHWTLERAQKARLAGKDNWTLYPQEMLRHRCEAEVCRTLFQDVIGNLYTPEEMAEFPQPIRVQVGGDTELVEDLEDLDVELVEAQAVTAGPSVADVLAQTPNGTETGAEQEVVPPSLQPGKEEPEMANSPSEEPAPVPTQPEAEASTVNHDRPSVETAGQNNPAPQREAAAMNASASGQYVQLLPFTRSIKTAILALDISNDAQLANRLVELAKKPGVGAKKVEDIQEYLRAAAIRAGNAIPPQAEAANPPQAEEANPAQLAGRELVLKIATLEAKHPRAAERARRELGSEAIPVEEMTNRERRALMAGILKHTGTAA